MAPLYAPVYAAVGATEAALDERVDVGKVVEGDLRWLGAAPS